MRRVVIGSFEGQKSPVSVFTDTIYVDLNIAPGKSAPFARPIGKSVRSISSQAKRSSPATTSPTISCWSSGLATKSPSPPVLLGCHVMLFGGAALGSARHIWWNFVSSSKERIEKAKEEWRTGRFDIVPGDEEEFVPLPTG